MTVYKVELKQCFDTSSSVAKTYYFNNETDAKEFIEEGNQILTNSRAYNYGLYGPKELEINIVEDVNKELNQLKQDFKGYRY
jgi:YHS domain-containing protein